MCSVQLQLMWIQLCQAPVTELERYTISSVKSSTVSIVFLPGLTAIQGFWPLGQAALWMAALLGDMSSLARYSQWLGPCRSHLISPSLIEAVVARVRGSLLHGSQQLLAD